MNAPAALCACTTELRAPLNSPLSDQSAAEELATLVYEGSAHAGFREEVALAAGLDPAGRDSESLREQNESRFQMARSMTFTPSPSNFPTALLPFRDRLSLAAPASTVSSCVDWSRLVAVETTEALNEVPEFVPPGGGESGYGSPTPKGVSLEVNSGGQVFFGLLSPEPGKDQEEAVVIKFCNSRHMLQSEQMSAELAWHLEVAAPVSRLLLKAHDGAEWHALASAAQDLSEDLHQTLQRKQSMLLLQFIAGANLRGETDAWEEPRLNHSCHAIGRLLVLDMLLGNSDRLPIQSLAWRGNPSNVLWSTGDEVASAAGKCVPIDAVVARRPPKSFVQATDEKVGCTLELMLLDRKSAQQILLEAVSCNSAGVAAVTSDWAPTEPAWTKQRATAGADERPHSAVKAFHEGVKCALELALREQGLLEMIVDVIRSWLDTFLSDMNEVATAASAKLTKTGLLRDLTRQANHNVEVKNRLSSWQALLQEKSCALRQAADEWATRRDVSTAMSFKGFLGDTVLNPVADAYELLVRLQHLIDRVKVMANAAHVTRPSDLSPVPLFVGPSTSCCCHLLRKLGVTCILNCTTDLFQPPEDALGTSIRWHRISIEDTESTDISQAVEEGLRIIDDVVKDGGRVLVHCHEGKSRSVSLCLAYMVTRERRSLADALTFIKSKRSVARPNAGFFKQLFALELATLGSNSMTVDDLPKGKPVLSGPSASRKLD